MIPLDNTAPFNEWEVVCIDSESYAIYRKNYNEEWQDEHGDNLVFDSAEEANQYLKNVFDKERTDK